MIVLHHPSQRSKTPTTADEIPSRLTEISFNAAFLTELNTIVLAKEEAERGLFRFGRFGRLDRRFAALNMHVIDGEEFMNRLDPLTKLNAHPSMPCATEVAPSV